uniref:Uncharacterized protein n=1 Tax=Oryza glumipatula TaxID=40148 RepID=A0A0E0AK82_9ORYZ
MPKAQKLLPLPSPIPLIGLLVSSLLLAFLPSSSVFPLQRMPDLFVRRAALSKDVVAAAAGAPAPVLPPLVTGGCKEPTACTKVQMN